ncbi:serine hydrolase domain-containing protein [Polyangium sp. y55x31]|uniref:serine hydrolase domain-containing protein n=1 Tax=Polyangium sp. y55x31 TaxID=3042688 RepID=UPI002482189A|nr:serine hydrolase domain-containing protein [Polyangium sp. y55x31]MDI1483646.1 serine hydrolase domain-containing protein [Polyangium sp. y55x31]
MRRLAFAALFTSIVVAPALASADASSATQPYSLQYAVSPSQVCMDADYLSLASAHVQSAVNTGKIDGAVLLVARHGKVVLHKAYGKRDGNFAGPSAQNPSMPKDGIFDLQSITKIFTAFVAIDLHDDGSLDLSDPVANYLPEFATPEKSGVLVADLVRFTSGHSVDAAASLLGDPAPWSTMLAESLAYTPSTAVLYSDIAYRLLGRVAEAAGGAPLDVLVKNRITSPLGMKDTAWRPLVTMPTKSSRFVGTGYSTVRETNGAPRYMRGEVADEQDYWIESNGHGVTGCDGAFSTAWDLALLGQMFLNRGARVVGNTSYGYCTPWMWTCGIDLLASPTLVEGMMSLQSKNASGAPLGISGATSSWLDDLLFANKGHGWELADTVAGAHVVTGLYSTPYAVSKIGAAGTFLTVDPHPSRDLVIVLLTNHGLPTLAGPDGIQADASGNLIWPSYEGMMNGIAPDVVNDLVHLSIVGP